MWYGREECGAVIKESWEKQVQGPIEAEIPWKLGGFRKSLTECSKNSFRNNKTNINMRQTKLKAIANRNTMRDEDEENKIKEQLKDLWNRKKIY